MLVNNAGIQRRVQLAQPEEWTETHREIVINLEAPVHLSTLFLAILSATGLTFISTGPANAQTCSSSTIQGNCVMYARSQVSMPSIDLTYIDLTYYSAKFSIINHRFPRVGSVAVMPVSDTNAPYGHVAVVRNVAVNSNGTLRVQLQESNWSACQITLTWVTPESRNIQGYFDPAYPSAQESPLLNYLYNNTGPAGQQFYVSVSGSGFDPNSVQGIIMGGWCDAFGKCAIPTGAIANRNSTSMQVPVTLNSPGTYTLYLFNQASGKTSNGKQITVY